MRPLPFRAPAEESILKVGEGLQRVSERQVKHINWPRN